MDAFATHVFSEFLDLYSPVNFIAYEGNIPEETQIILSQVSASDLISFAQALCQHPTTFRLTFLREVIYQLESRSPPSVQRRIGKLIERDVLQRFVLMPGKHLSRISLMIRMIMILSPDREGSEKTKPTRDFRLEARNMKTTNADYADADRMIDGLMTNIISGGPGGPEADGLVNFLERLTGK